MKTILKLTFAALALSVFACKKSEIQIGPAAGVINVTNAVVGGSTITLTATNNIISSSNTVGTNSGAFFPLTSGNVVVNLGVPAVPATLTTAAIPAVSYYSNTLTIDNTSNYSLFLTGASPVTVESVLIKESYPRTYPDSVCGVRIINLAPGSNPISVNIKGAAIGSEVASLAYKSYSNFILHPAKAANANYIFEFRDAALGTIISSYTLTTPYLHNITLCLRGKVGGSPAAGVTVNYDY